MKPVWIIVLQYGKFDLTRKCFETLRAQTFPVKIFFVDGFSPNRDMGELQELAKLADKYLFLDQNLGYAGGNNRAIELLLPEKPDYLMILNNDTELDPDCVEQLMKVATDHPEAGEICPLVFYPNGKLQAAGGKIVKPLFEPQLLGHLEAERTDLKGYDSDAKVECSPGAAFLVKVEALAKVGLISEDYFMYCEDFDWSLAMLEAGFEIWRAGKAKLTHHDSAALGSFHRKKGYMLVRANALLAAHWTDERGWGQFKRSNLWKNIKQSIKNIKYIGYVRGIWDGFRAGLKEGEAYRQKNKEKNG